MEYFTLVDGLRIRYLEQGAGPAVVMLHGASLGSSADVWEGTLGSLSEAGYRGLAYDQPGFGHSDNPIDYTVSYRTALILKFMDALKIEQACLIGYDQPGFGHSDNPLDYRVSYRTAFILKFMDALKIEQACFIGHSQAGGMVVRLALEHRARVSKVVVVGSGSLLPPLPPSRAGRDRLVRDRRADNHLQPSRTRGRSWRITCLTNR
jgi:pimeloyl-ACP methyl ester carboxylesterase